MQLLRGTAAEFLATALCLSALIGCQGDDGLDVAADDDTETAAQWMDEAQTPSAPAAGNCGDRLLPGQERNCRFNGRSYTIRAGRTMNADAPVPVVIDLPSVTSTPAQILGRERFCFAGVCWNSIGSGWAAESDTPGGGFIVVVPDRSGLALGDEPAYLRNLVNEIRRVADVDLRKVYVTGASDAGNVSLDFGCNNADFFAGIAPHSGSNANCRPRRPIPTIAFAARPDITYQANYNATEAVARANGCRGEAQPWRTFDRNTRDAVCRTANNDPRARIVPCSEVTNARIQPTECRVWTGCREGAEVVFCDVAAANPHGVLYASTDAHVLYENATLLNTPSVAWRFFKQHW